MTTGPTAPPLSLYLHLPWCKAKCPYCDFNSHRAGDAPPRARYVAALLADLDAEAERAAGRELCSIFLGGGTPSLFLPEEIAAVLEACRQGFALSPDCEITMEANPGTVEHGSLAGYRAAGVNRLSLGVQSFDAASLARLGRIHGPREIHEAYAEAQAAGFDSINLDLMFALPGQDIAGAAADVGQLIDLGPPHVSYYQLTLEPNTIFHARPPADLPDADRAFAIQERGHAMLAAAGYQHYEISAFARPGHRCRHNLNYWTFGDYLAAGAGAHGKLTGTDGIVRRYRKPAHPASYMATVEAHASGEAPSPVGRRDLGFEFMLNVLRLADGFSEADFERGTGQPISQIRPSLDRARDDGLLEMPESGRWRPTALGFRFLNDLQARFLP